MRGGTHAHGDGDEQQASTCPQFAVKSIMGHRQGMEDSYAAVPDVVLIPGLWTASSSDVLPLASTITYKQVDEFLDAGRNCLSPSPAPASSYPLHLFAVYDGHGERL